LATLPLVMNCLVPLSTYSSPSRLALVLTFDESEPALDSVMAKAASSPAASLGSHFFFCSSVPPRMIGNVPSPQAA